MIERIPSFLAKYENQRFRYGRSDCVTFAFQSLEELWGIKMPKDEIGIWHNKKEATQAIQRHGGGLYEAACRVAAKMGLVYIYRPLLRCGDVASVNVGGRVGLGLMENAADAVCLGPKGLVRIPQRFATGGWRVSDA